MTDVDDEVEDDAEEEMLREGSREALKCIAMWAPLEAAIVFFAIKAASAAITASQQLFTGGSAYWYEASMPAALAAMVGGGLGVFLGWRMTSSSGLAGPAGWRIGMLGWSLVGAVAILAAFTTFTPVVPTFFWVVWTVLMIAGSCGVSLHTLWVS